MKEFKIEIIFGYSETIDNYQSTIWVYNKDGKRINFDSLTEKDKEIIRMSLKTFSEIK